MIGHIRTTEFGTVLRTISGAGTLAGCGAGMRVTRVYGWLRGDLR